VGQAQFPQSTARSDTGLLVMTRAGRRHAGRAPRAHRDLQCAITVGVDVFFLNNAIRLDLNDRNRNGYAIIVEHARHAALATYQTDTHLYTFSLIATR